MDDAHAAQAAPDRVAQELRQQFARGVYARAMQVQLILDDPVTATQLAQDVRPDARTPE
jgi:D-Tyr-tRNAtyr deacylase